MTKSAADALIKSPEVVEVLKEARGSKLDARAPSKGFAKIDKALIGAGAFYGLSLTAFHVYLFLGTLCYEKQTPSMKRKGLGMRDCLCGYALLAKRVPGRNAGEGASRGALKNAVRQLIEAGLVELRRKGTGPNKPNLYHLRNWQEWRSWSAAEGKAAVLGITPNARDTAERKKPRDKPPRDMTPETKDEQLRRFLGDRAKGARGSTVLREPNG